LALFAGTIPAASMAKDCTAADPCTVKLLDGSLSNDGRAEITYRLTVGEPVYIDIIEAPGSSGFDPVLQIRNAAGDVIGNDDDGGFGLGARVLVNAETRADADIRLIITSSGGGEVAEGAGKFQVLIRPSGFLPTAMRTIGEGKTASFTGDLRADDPQRFRFQSEKGREWSFSASAANGSEVDPAIRIVRANDVSSTQIAYDDDGGEGFAASLKFVAPRAGDYMAVIVQSMSVSGAYEFTAERGGIVEIPANDPKALGFETVTANFRPTYGVADAEGTLFYFIADESGGADPKLDMGVTTPLGFASIKSDDDGGQGLNSRITLSAGEISGAEGLENLRIEATDLNGSSDEFTIKVTFE
jgi:hypothetical protein